MSIPASIPDTSLGLTTSEIQILRHQQQIVNQGHTQSQYASRGRGTARVSNSSSRNASAASSQGRLILDPGSLSTLSRHFGSLMDRISHQLNSLQDQVDASVARTHDRHGNGMANADTEIRRVKAILQKMDDLEIDFERIKRIRDAVKHYRNRVESLDARLERLSLGSGGGGGGGRSRRR